MSSVYRILCLSHDPAITINTPDWNRPQPAEEAIREGLPGHPHCDLAIGRYSYPLVELGCPATRDQPANLTCCHGSTAWTSKEWLLLLAAAYQPDDPAVQQALKDGHHHCLPWERLRKLRDELGITTTDPRQALRTALGNDRTAQVIAHTLHTHGHTLTDLRTMTDEQLLAVPGLRGPSMTRIRACIPSPTTADRSDPDSRA